MRLSICIATFNRAGYIGQTLDAILAQRTPQVELVVVDGASEDGTAALMGQYLVRYPHIVYRRETENSGVDRDFDKAVGYASGDYCWLMSDDDVIKEGALQAVLSRMARDPQLIIVNAEIRDRDLRRVIKQRQLEVEGDKEYGPSEHERFFADAGSYLSFIGGVVVQREWWLRRDRATYYGSLFIHVGVIFQQPAPRRVKVIAQPLVEIRYGNAQWSARGFEIWMTMWPRLVWSFEHFSRAARRRVTPAYPSARLQTLLWYRAIGVYGPRDLDRLDAEVGPANVHHGAGIVSRLPPKALNALLALYCFASPGKEARMKLYDLARAQVASRLARWLARDLGRESFSDKS